MIDWYIEIVVLYRYTVGSVRTEHHVFFIYFISCRLTLDVIAYAMNCSDS